MGERAAIDLRALATVALLSLVAVSPLLVANVSVADIIGLNLSTLLQPVILLLVLLPLPAAYVSTISYDRFRFETLGATIILPLYVVSPVFAAAGAGMLLGLMLTSYKARSLYKGDNGFYTSWKATKTTMVLLAVAGGIFAAATYSTSTGVQADVQGNLTEESVDLALDQLDIGSISGSQTQQLVDQSRRISETASRLSIEATQRIVFDAITADGSFSQQQRGVVRGGFRTAKNEVPENVSQQIAQNVEDQLAQRNGGTTGSTESLVRPQVEQMVQQLARPTPPVLAAIFFITFSLLALFKLPFGLIGGIYSVLIIQLPPHHDAE